MAMIKYKCNCNPYEVSLEVIDRKLDQEHSMYMEMVKKTVSIDHSIRLKRCGAKVMKYIKIQP